VFERCEEKADEQRRRKGEGADPSLALAGRSERRQSSVGLLGGDESKDELAEIQLHSNLNNRDNWLSFSAFPSLSRRFLSVGDQRRLTHLSHVLLMHCPPHPLGLFFFAFLCSATQRLQQRSEHRAKYKEMEEKESHLYNGESETEGDG